MYVDYITMIYCYLRPVHTGTANWIQTGSMRIGRVHTGQNSNRFETGLNSNRFQSGLESIHFPMWIEPTQTGFVCGCVGENVFST